MIISASRRTDIPAYYSDWFFKRLKEGYVHVRNPLNFRQVSLVSLAKKDVAGLVFWTKDPTKMLSKLSRLEGYSYYFQFTVTPFGKQIEPHLCKKTVVETFKKLAMLIGKDRVIWRYDPIIITDYYKSSYYVKEFLDLAEELSESTEKCIVSFLDLYPKIKRKMQNLGVKSLDREVKKGILTELSHAAKTFGIHLETCAEDIDLETLSVQPARCVDDRLLKKISGKDLKYIKDKNQRPFCGCTKSIDIGAYNTCPGGCIYCYASSNRTKIANNLQNYKITSSLLCSDLTVEDSVYPRQAKSSRIVQKSLFD